MTLLALLVALWGVKESYVPSYFAECQWGRAYMKQAELKIGVDVGVGNGRAVVWTCDLTRGYIDINADYRS